MSGMVMKVRPGCSELRPIEIDGALSEYVSAAYWMRLSLPCCDGMRMRSGDMLSLGTTRGLMQ